MANSENDVPTAISRLPTTMISQPSLKPPLAADVVSELRGDRPSPRWTLHGLNNGYIFGATCRLVGALPRRLTYAVGRRQHLAGLATDAADAPGDRRQPARDRARTRPLAARERRALDTLRSYACDVVDFLRAIGATDEAQRQLFDFKPEHARVFETLLGAGTRHHPRQRPLRQLGNRQRADARVQSPADDRGDGGGESGGQPAASGDARAPRCRYHRSPEIARHRAADSPPAGRQPHRRDVDGSALRPRPRGGDAGRPARVVPQDAGADGPAERRAAGSLLHRTYRTGAIQRVCPASRSSWPPTSRASRPFNARRSSSPIS